MEFDHYASKSYRTTTVLQLEFEKGMVLVACKGTLRRKAPRRGGGGGVGGVKLVFNEFSEIFSH